MKLHINLLTHMWQLGLLVIPSCPHLTHTFVLQKSMHCCITIDICIKLLSWLSRTCQFCSKAHQIFIVNFWLCAQVCNLQCRVWDLEVYNLSNFHPAIHHLRHAGCGLPDSCTQNIFASHILWDAGWQNYQNLFLRVPATKITK